MTNKLSSPLGKVFGSAIGMLCAIGCSSPAQSNVTQRPVETAYAALVRDAASCGKQVSTCTKDAADDAARTACRDQFSSCRDQAGHDAVSQLTSAIKDCTSQHRACKQTSAGADSCQTALQDCLGVAKDARQSGADHGAAGHGSDHGAAGHGSEHAQAVGDCVDALHMCVKGDEDAKVCAEQVRACVLESVPAPDDVVPGAGKDGEHGASDHADKGDAGVDKGNMSNGGMGKDADAGAPDQKPTQPSAAGTHGNSAGHGNSAAGHGNSAAGHGGGAGAAAGDASDSAMACLDAFTACVDAGSEPRECAKSLQHCPRGAKH